jgi:hypothetical protein
MRMMIVRQHGSYDATGPRAIDQLTNLRFVALETMFSAVEIF